RPEDEFDRIYTLNTSNHRQNRDMGNTTPVPPIEKVKHVLTTDEAQNNNQSQDSFNYEVAVSG
ncbi:1494_t:CDS:2, partial [Cetraspora pellucida]